MMHARQRRGRRSRPAVLAGAGLCALILVQVWLLMQGFLAKPQPPLPSPPPRSAAPSRRQDQDRPAAAAAAAAGLGDGGNDARRNAPPPGLRQAAPPPATDGWHGGPPASYLDVLAELPPEPAVAQLAGAETCLRREDWTLEAALRKAGNTKCAAAMGKSDFACQAQCAAREPELERSFGIFNIARYKLHGLLRLCKAQAIPFLVWVDSNRVKYLACQAQPTGKRVFHSSLSLLAALSCLVKLPDVVFGFDGNDYAVPQTKSPLKYTSAGWPHPLPGVVRMVGTDAQPSALFPTVPFLAAVGLQSLLRGGGEDLRKTVLRPVEQPHAWEARRDTIFWRGGTTGIPFDHDFVWMMPRPALCRRTKDLEGFDVAVTTADGVSSAMEAEGFFDYVRRERLTAKADFALYRHHLHVDGNTASWGLMHKLMLDAVVIWQRSPVTFREHYYDLLRPWEHYVPLAPDLGNLKQVRRWLSSDAGAAETAAMRERLGRLVRERLRPEDALCYVLRLLHSLAAQQSFAPGPALRELGPELGVFADKFETAPGWEATRKGKR